MSSPSLAEITERRDLGGCILRYSFSYRTLGEEYLTDVKMKLKKDRYIDWDDWHFPGSP
jgi:hypothetical protein